MAIVAALRVNRRHAPKSKTYDRLWRNYWEKKLPLSKEPAGLVVQPLDLHLVNVGAIPTGPTHGEVCRQPPPGDVLKSTPNAPDQA